ncbi:MAG: orotate phosphoribosyltransferase [Candidatus Omnitrophica bacterium]|nr:orotate phosphoribosyltransferase [Candidatus Omnitrophota bacterium]
MNQESVMKIFEEQGAFHKGHFNLSSGLHSEYYLQCALVLSDPKIAAGLCRELAAKFKGEKIGVVIGPAIGGITAAYEVARALAARGIFSEREEGKMALRRGFKLEPGEKVLVIEDVTTTGGSAQEVIDLVKGLGAEVVGVGAIIDRSGGKAKFSVPFKTLAQLKIETFRPEDCPLCKAGKPITKPGSRK